MTVDPAESGKGIRRLHTMWCVVMGVLVALTFWPVVEAGFAPFDDDVQLQGNSRIKSFSQENLRWMFTDTALTQRYTPLSWVAWAAVHSLAGMRPGAFHLQALVVHGINAILVYLLIVAIMRRLPSLMRVTAPAMTASAALGAALWAVHPMRVEVVGWATQVRYAEALACAVGAVLMYFAAVRRAPARPGRSVLFWGSAGLYAASLLFYPSAVMLVLLLPMLDVALLNRAAPAGGQYRLSVLGGLVVEKIPFFLAASGAGAMTVYGRVTAAGMWGSPVRLSEFGVVDRAMQAVYVFTFYLWKPLDVAHASHLYTEAADFRAWSPGSVASLAIVAAGTAAAVALRRHFPRSALLWFAHLLLLLPYGGYFEHPYLLGDRYGYMQGVVLAIGLAVLAAKLWESSRVTTHVRAAAGVACGAAILGLATLSHAQSYVWRDGVTLMRHVLAGLSPSDPYRKHLYWQLGKAHVDAGQFVEAIDMAGQTLRENPSDRFALRVKVEGLVGLAEQVREQPERYRALYLQAAETADKIVATQLNAENLRAAAILYQRAGRLEVAETRFLAAVAADPGDVELRLRAGEVQAQQGRMGAALGQLDAAIRLSPALEARRDEVLRAWTAVSPGPATGRRE